MKITTSITILLLSLFGTEFVQSSDDDRGVRLRCQLGKTENYNIIKGESSAEISRSRKGANSKVRSSYDPSHGAFDDSTSPSPSTLQYIEVTESKTIHRQSTVSVELQGKRHGLVPMFRRSVKAGWGFTYAPFKANGDCKNLNDILQDLKVAANDYSLIRIYGTSCNQVANVLVAARKYNFRIFAGVFDIDQVDQEAKIIIDAARGDWSRFETIAVGNEIVNAQPDYLKSKAAAKVVGTIKRARAVFQAAGFKGNIVTVDTWIAARAYPALCKASDFCAVNIHPFFDGNVEASGAGSFISEQLLTLAKVIPQSQRIVVTETGWPWKGDPNKSAVPSLPHQTEALNSIKKVFKNNRTSVILFNLYNDRWKRNNAFQFNAEQYWGMKGLDAPSG